VNIGQTFPRGEGQKIGNSWTRQSWLIADEIDDLDMDDAVEIDSDTEAEQTYKLQLVCTSTLVWTTNEQ
jgi:hypothetical protein